MNFKIIDVPLNARMEIYADILESVRELPPGKAVVVPFSMFPKRSETSLRSSLHQIGMAEGVKLSVVKYGDDAFAVYRKTK